MRGGLERWKRGVESQGVRQAISYALKGTCDSHLRASTGVDALAAYGDSGDRGVVRCVVENGVIATDRLDVAGLRLWVDGCDPESEERRGRDLSSPGADLLLDGTINAPKSYSIAALLNSELAGEFEALQDRLRDRTIAIWQRELNARRGAGGRVREALRRVEVVELQHRRSRALDPHVHRHLWLNVKVQGEDGLWSNVDSRVAMKLHTVINAEGELAARTDPAWIASLARHGYTLDGDGEIAQLATAVRPLSRRSTQIEANRAVLLTRWRDEHPGQHPSPDLLQQIDRFAWAKGRPNKPGDLDESDWEDLVRDELRAIDPTLLKPRSPVSSTVKSQGQVDRDLLAAKAIVEADGRSASCGGRFSMIDVRAGVIRAVAASGIVEHRSSLEPLIEDVVERALEHTIDLLDGEDDRPDHIKGYMSVAAAALKVDLAARFDDLTQAGHLADPRLVAAAADRVLNGVQLDERQELAAAAIAGTDRLVSVTGPAGAGKTTILRVAKEALAGQRRRMVVVAPTRKAASVAGREIGTTASSLHALLADHGWRWTRNVAGAEHWTHLRPGDPDPSRGNRPYPGPRRFGLGPEDRVVVDEAGMVDLHTANALAQVAAQTGAGIVMVGDPLQCMPVGHGGAMATLTRRATAVVELTSVHRFRDPEYAALTLRMREPASREVALEVATELHTRGQIRHVVDSSAARDMMVGAYFRHAAAHGRVALVTGTNEEADAINEAIQQRRLDTGELHARRIAVGAGEQRLLEGDTVQTRCNDTRAKVDNRALWTISRITHDAVDLVSVTDSAERRTVGREYASQFVHLAYASTVHGMQGETTTTSIVGPGVDASGLYVGMTRGRAHNEAIVISRTPPQAIEAIADTMMRGAPEITIDDARRAARTDLTRAARTTRDAPRWDDQRFRPFGRVLDISAAISQQEVRHTGLAAKLDEDRRWIGKTERAVLELDARAAKLHAATHGRRITSAADLDNTAKRALILERIGARRRRIEKLSTQVMNVNTALAALIVERKTRSSLLPTQTESENRARTNSAQTRTIIKNGASIGR